ncbi:hypothetical protein AB0878_46375 [Amycolatopsis sp. NPDC047767]|uniref:hypothetical protein n=1 Tax=Amycolatopsis sp. NPDC047767 TaxID=3156765 RepID=UPI003452A6BB
MTARWTHLRADDRGDLTIEAAVGVLALILLLGLGIVGMRLQIAQAAVTEAARAAARTVSLAHDGRSATTQAQDTARTVLAQQSLTCAELNVSAISDGHGAAGEGGDVVVRVTCTVPYGDVIPGLSGARTIRSEFRSPLDRYGVRT